MRNKDAPQATQDDNTLRETTYDNYFLNDIENSMMLDDSFFSTTSSVYNTARTESRNSNLRVSF